MNGGCIVTGHHRSNLYSYIEILLQYSTLDNCIDHSLMSIYSWFLSLYLFLSLSRLRLYLVLVNYKKLKKDLILLDFKRKFDFHHFFVCFISIKICLLSLHRFSWCNLGNSNNTINRSQSWFFKKSKNK